MEGGDEEEEGTRVLGVLGVCCQVIAYLGLVERTCAPAHLPDEAGTWLPRYIRSSLQNSL